MLLKYHKITGYFLILLSFYYLFFDGFVFQNLKTMLWFSHFSTLMLGFAFLLRSKLLFSMVLISAVPIELPWIIDYFVLILNLGNYGLGDYLYANPPLSIFFSVLLHFSIIPLAYYGTYKLGFEKNSVKYMFLLYGFFILPLSYYLSDSYTNINCLAKSCSGFNLLPFQEHTFSYFLSKELYYILISYIFYLFWKNFFQKKRKK